MARTAQDHVFEIKRINVYVRTSSNYKVIYSRLFSVIIVRALLSRSYYINKAWYIKLDLGFEIGYWLGLLSA